MSKPVETIDGIGSRNGSVLRQAGIGTVEKLLKFGGTRPGRRALAAQTGIDEKQLLRCVNIADLFRIKGVAGQYAELLEAAGVDTVKELRHRNAGNLAAKMAQVNADCRLVRVVPSTNRVARWIFQAKVLRPKVKY